jgi:DNA-binding YbaB/EbfC family protein
MNPQQLQKMAMKMQNEMQRIQQELGETYVTGSAGGEMVKVTMNCHREISAIEINPEVVDPDPSEVEALQEMLLAAINDASRQAQETAEQRMKPIPGGMPIPGLF